MAKATEVIDPVLSLTRLGEGRYDIDNVLARLKPPENQPVSDPTRFAPHKLRLNGGQVDFNDLPVGKTHPLRDLTLSVPFLTNLQSQYDIKTAPHLAFKLNGSSFDTAAEGAPLVQARKTDATFKLSAIDLKPYSAYLPASLPFRL